MNSQLENILFLDLETVKATHQYHEMEERLRKQWDKKSVWLNKDGNKLPEDIFTEKGGIYAEFGKIVVIGLGFIKIEDGEPTLRIKALKNHDEKALLTEFIDIINKFPPNDLCFCAHNGKEFDYPFLSRRMLVNGLQLPDALRLSGKKPWEIKHLDTLDLWKFGDYKHYTSLELLAALFNIPSSKDDIDGSMVDSIYYKEQDLDRICKYCAQDVVVTTQLYMRLIGKQLIKDTHIIYVDENLTLTED
ncbi:MAG: ribonuclease H-like domain-containing protein [Candidatus Cyclobacteriaceae bacterium M2_1C_046]